MLKGKLTLNEAKRIVNLSFCKVEWKRWVPCKFVVSKDIFDLLVSFEECTCYRYSRYMLWGAEMVLDEDLEPKTSIIIEANGSDGMINIPYFTKKQQQENLKLWNNLCS